MIQRLKQVGLLGVLAALAACNVTIIESDCLKVIASKVEKDGLMVAISGISITTGEDCKKLKKARYVCYREKNGEAGYQPDGTPPDQYVDHKDGNLNEASTELMITDVSNNHSNNGVADSWQLEIEHEDGGQSTFSGNF